MKRRFTAEQVYMLRVDYVVHGYGVKQLAARFGCNRKVVQDMVNFRTYKNVGGPKPKRERICPRCRQVLVRRGAV